MSPIADSDARDNLAEIPDRAASGDERDVATRQGMPASTQAYDQTLVKLSKSKALASGDLNLALREITEATARCLRTDRASIWRLDSAQLTIRCLDLYLLDQSLHRNGFELTKSDYSSFFDALEAERTIAATDARADPRTREFTENHLGSQGSVAMLGVPIRIAGDLVGVACLEETRGPRRWTPEEQSFAGSVGDQIALTLQVFQHKQAEQAIRDREERFRDIANVASDWFWETDATLSFSYVSDRFLEVTGTSLQSILGRSHLDVMAAGSTPESAQTHLLDLSERRCFRDYRFQTIDPLGRAMVWSVSGNPIFNESGEFEGYRGSGTDITHQVEMAQGLKAAKEAAEVASRAKSEFLANMSHELRTPLNAIIGFSEMISQEVMGPMNNSYYTDYATDIHESGTHLLSLINDILDLSKVEAGKTELHEQPVDLRQTIKSTLRIIGERLQAAELRLEVDLMSPLPLIFADLRAIKQIMLNLMSNAVKFTPEGGLIRISVRSDTQGALLLSIADSGIGISEEDMPTALAPFGQVESALNRRHQGTGLGLPLVRSLVELHGGTLEVSSRVGTGTVVTVRLPEERVIASESAEQPAARA